MVFHIFWTSKKQIKQPRKLNSQRQDRQQSPGFVTYSALSGQIGKSHTLTLHSVTPSTHTQSVQGPSDHCVPLDLRDPSLAVQLPVSSAVKNHLAGEYSGVAFKSGDASKLQ